jgi:hypothetical protein
MAKTLCLLAIIALVSADVYMHNPRGSNNRLNENNQNRNNANRLFDSQNNNQGGYNVGDLNAAQDGQGKMVYYASSILSFEWTNQHGGNNPNLNTNVVVSYMCDDNAGPFATAGLRDGTATNTVDPNDADNAANGRHESAAEYNACAARDRNKGLFIADQNLDANNENAAIFTRQNTNGQRSGLECPEEREYYPYWHPTSWKDLAVLTSEPERCPYYLENTINRASNVRGYCNGNAAANNAADCAANGGTWTNVQGFGIPDPSCGELAFSRDNHLGNTLGLNTLSLNVSIPNDLQGKDCVARLRYNISTGDYDGWTINATSNGDASPVQDNPTVNFGTAAQAISVKLAMNSDQFGRTFEDRTHVFGVQPRPANLAANVNIYNLNVRGRRGNIVQTYPAVEYDYTPQNLVIKSTDVVHLQWTGSLNTPDGAGSGAGNTDRSNVVQIASSNNNYPLNLDEATMFPRNVLEAVATVGQGAGVDDELDNAPAYFDAGIQSVGNGVPGNYFYMSTRNNNFTNRSQKGVITVV